MQTSNCQNDDEENIPSVEVQSDSDAEQYSRNQYKKKEKVSLKELIKSQVFINTLIISAVIAFLLSIALLVIYERNNSLTVFIDTWKENLPSEQAEWFDSGLNELKIALKMKKIGRKAKNVIIFIGDGMGPSTVTATRIYKYGESGLLSWEKFPQLGLLKTYCMDYQVPESSSTATALFTGVKVNFNTTGVDSSVLYRNCKSLNDRNHVESILKWAQDDGMRTGFVTTARVTHATPAALYAHTVDRNWECEATMSETVKQEGCKDVARQLIEDLPGKNINVIMGGGRQCLVSNITGTPNDPVNTQYCISADGRNLINEWKYDKINRKLRHVVVQNNEELDELNAVNTDYVLGIFANDHFKFDGLRDKGPQGMPSIQKMTEKAILTLKRNKNGFLLVVEGALIDGAHHSGRAGRALAETSAMDDAVDLAIEIMKEELDKTLIIVTADHDHSLSINGYPKRGNNILGIAQKSGTDGIPYTTLTYGTGAPISYQVEIGADGKPKRSDPSKVDTTDLDYIQQATISTNKNGHAGTDVAIYARGPMAHLFHGTHEQSFVAHAVSFAARIGRFQDSDVAQSLLNSIEFS